ncbi:hypothetical protein BCR35DRAFT_300657 [Leucosporidium creatinivorum]|uniref:Uncharacterized protein n=1 Tax=Leucosporidium creatinivorum TaxID=106004 RepID=A0A1Y2FZG2_9BASI|nr:hypothetical protein BCR35DRAFT_300657 [Leucosporidium creatinivorum]
MSARRLARQGLLLVEHQQPVASTSSLPPCPACRRSSTTALPFAVHSRAHDSPSTQQRASSWAAISRAGQAIFNPPTASPTAGSTTARETSASAVELEGAAAELVAECKLKKPSGQRAWALFQQVDLEGKTGTIPLITLHSLLAAIHLPSPKNHDQLQVTQSTSAARAYSSKVDIIRLRISQAGGTTSKGDLNAMLRQFHELGYAPGVSKVWDEMMEMNYHPTPGNCKTFFSTLLRWIDMHERGGGRIVAKVAAKPLVAKAVSMLEELKGDSLRTNAVLEPFFKIALRARDAQVFFVAMKAVYGFDVNYPGADVDVSPTVRASQKVMGEKEVCWVLEMLGEEDDLSRMIAVFEVFDNPSSNHSVTSFFGPSFTTSTPSDSTTSPSTDLPSSRPHPIGTRAFSYMVQTAGRLGHGALVRHYFDQLRDRWAYESDARIARLEAVVQAATPAPVPEDGFIDIDLPAAPTSHFSAPAGMPTTPTEKPYGVPSTLVRDMIKAAKQHSDYATSRFVRMRTRWLLQTMGDQATRISAVLDKLEPTASTPSSAPPRSLILLAHEIDLLNFHQYQLQSMHTIVKADSNVIHAYSYFRHRAQGLRVRLARLEKAHAASGASKRAAIDLRPRVRRWEKTVLLSQILVVKQRLVRLYKMGRARKGRVEFDRWQGKLARLRAKANDRGLKESEEEEVEGAEALFVAGGAMGTRQPETTTTSTTV